jgi:hypothetical protein
MFSLVAGLGFEPRLTASKAAVLPLDDPAIVGKSGFEPPLAGLAIRIFPSNNIPIGPT